MGREREIGGIEKWQKMRGDLSMCIKGYISEKNPLAKLIEDPYALGILNPEVDFEVELMNRILRINIYFSKENMTRQ